MNSENNYTDSSKDIQEVRVNAEELAASFPESTRFDTPPSSLLNISNLNAHAGNISGDETAFYPIENIPTLEPINDSITGRKTRQKEDRRIHQNMQGLASMKLRAEVPYFKQQELEAYTVELKDALYQREEHLKLMGTSFRNAQRAFTNRVKDYDQRITLLEKSNRNKMTAIKGICSLLLITSVIPFFLRSNHTANDQKKIDPVANNFKSVQYTPDETQKNIYTVQPRDTLYSISQKFYGDTKFANTILKSNNLNSKKLTVGTKLLIAQID